jgi:hypothetical protein
MNLISKIESGGATVGVIGLGYVGLPLLAAFHRAGFATIGFDVDPRKVEALQRGENYLKHLGDDLVRDLKTGAKFDATADFARLADCDAIISCVPTPLGNHLEPDLSYVEKTADDIARTIVDVVGLAAHRNLDLLRAQCDEYPRARVVVTDESCRAGVEAEPSLRKRCIGFSEAALSELARDSGRRAIASEQER